MSEVTCDSHPILAKDVHIGENKKKFLLILRTSKTHGLGTAPQMVKISAKPLRIKTGRELPGLKPPCLYMLLKTYAQLRGPYQCDEDPFFVFADHTPVAARHMSSQLKFFIKRCGFDQKQYGTHSLRSGRTCDLYKLGFSVETIKKIGCWKSNAVFRYLKN